MRDFKWSDALWFVVKDDGTYAGKPCLSFEEARDLAAQHQGAHIFAGDNWGTAFDSPTDEEEIDDATIAMRESLGENWW